MNNAKFLPQVQQCISSVFNIDPGSITPEATYETVPGWDSLGHLRLIMAVEEAFAIRFNTEEIPTLLSVRLLCDAIGKYVS